MPRTDRGEPRDDQLHSGRPRRGLSTASPDRDSRVDDFSDGGRPRPARRPAIWPTAAVSAMLHLAVIVAIGLLPAKGPPPVPPEQSISVEILSEAQPSRSAFPAPPPGADRPR